ncbi:MAG: RNA-binding protein [Nanoarchaeota archaeon]|jgi:exosome complex component RRP4|nr:RNA-binding protein [Nanoarchaeota archaeon]|tara:strand:+ start:27774 stop:28463 length:690 start_codon:yes stop_codon:yes gene_type:complete
MNKMGNILIENKKLVVPGEVIAEGMDFLPAVGVMRDGDKLVANKIGLVNIDNRLVKLIPLSGAYNPKVGDNVIGQVVNIGFNGWAIDFGFSNNAQLPLRDASRDFIDRNADLSQYYDFGDYMIAKISSVSKSNLVDLTMKGPGLMKLNKANGKIVDIASSKVPRVIGKQGSMISLLKRLTDCKIFVGQNGKVWIEGENVNKAIEAIKLIERKSHLSGLTEEIEKLLGGK